MSTKTLLVSLFNYKSSVDRELLEALRAVADDADPAAFAAALRVLNHAVIVDRIFIANLRGEPHGYRSSWNAVAPLLAQLDATLRQSDGWYLDYVRDVPEEELEEELSFSFSDGGRGLMSREEMLAHIVTHSGYHRGEIGRLLPTIEATAERDVFTGYLHRSEPRRRA